MIQTHDELQRVLDQQRRDEDAEVGAALEEDLEEGKPKRQRFLRGAWWQIFR